MEQEITPKQAATCLEFESKITKSLKKILKSYSLEDIEIIEKVFQGDSQTLKSAHDGTHKTKEDRALFVKENLKLSYTMSLIFSACLLQVKRGG